MSGVHANGGQLKPSPECGVILALFRRCGKIIKKTAAHQWARTEGFQYAKTDTLRRFALFFATGGVRLSSMLGLREARRTRTRKTA
jgi:hypothetical protein